MDRFPDSAMVAWLHDLEAEYWHRVDHPGTAEVADLYLPEGKMLFGDFQVIGRDAIRAFFARRNARLPRRTTRHIVTNLRARQREDGHAALSSVVLVFAGVGDTPIPSAAPSAILDFEAVCVREGDGWRYLSRSGHTIAIGPGAAPFLTDQLPDDHPLKTTPD